ncbi:MAG: thioredoxin domain-containing protein [Desulfobulbaceae bacterium]|nr:thioredoxin domain-containing protein [Desulfobulbaceae bacterium]
MKDKPNRLIREQSPYLLQHAFNPVDWYPWSDEALAKAKTENKPIFLSVGYSTCHWCHVMAHESFEDPAVAELLNKWFVAIKVDREERPDIDQIYMAATQAMTGGGGWPMSVFLLPDGSPFYAGTYFPPKGKYGRPGFQDLLTSLHDAWLHKRSDIENVARQMIIEMENSAGAGAESGVDSDAATRTFQFYNADFDTVHGGFGTTLKFPRPVVLDFLLQYWHRNGNTDARDMVVSTLVHMARGGIYDHLGGGFHRYATDRGWREPHFEKMLYDQSQLANIYLDAFLITRAQMFGAVASDILEYVRRDMTAPEGGFYSAEDADSEDPYCPGKHGEGAFYLWTEDEVKSLLDPRAAEIFSYCYGVLEGGNAPEDPQGEFIGRNILYMAHSMEEAGTRFNIPVEELKKILQQAKQILYDQRSKRTKPHLDDKIITAWNGLMIGAFARGSIILGQPHLLDTAAAAAAFLKSSMLNEDHTLCRRFRNGTSGLPGQLDDYTFLVRGLLELYQAGRDPQWLELAVQLTGKMIEMFWNDSRKGFYDSVQDPSLPVRMRGHYDGAEPSGNSMAAMNLLRLALLTGNDDWRERAEETMESFGSIINMYPDALPLMLCAGMMNREKPTQVVVAGPPARKDTLAMITGAFSVYDPGMIILHADGSRNQEFLAKYLPFIKSMEMVADKATAYVCRDFTCKMPVTEIDALVSQLTDTVDR